MKALSASSSAAFDEVFSVMLCVLANPKRAKQPIQEAAWDATVHC
jgi:hypothetical protein